MKRRLDIDKIAKKLGAHREGRVEARDGYFGAMQLVAEIQARFRVPSTGGRATNPDWSTKRLVGLSPETLQRLEELARATSEAGETPIEPMQLAALLLEKAVVTASKEKIKKAS
jgi:hypothetical protein